MLVNKSAFLITVFMRGEVLSAAPPKTEGLAGMSLQRTGTPVLSTNENSFAQPHLPRYGVPPPVKVVVGRVFLTRSRHSGIWRHERAAQ
jgi:hypothetical protein